MFTKTFSYIFIFICIAASAFAQPATDRRIELKNCSITITANEFTATTVLEMEFYNPNQKVLDGEYNFSLQPEQVITGFALDINGFMREGVIVDKQKGRVAYENTIRRRIDPGLLEMTAGNNYRVRIYPMPARGTRKISVQVSQLLAIKNDALLYFFPLNIKDTIQQFAATCTVNNSTEKPIIADGLLNKKEFEKTGSIFLLQHTANNVLAQKPLSFKIPLPQTTSIIGYTGGSESNFILHVKTPADTLPLKNVEAFTVLWDVSSSASARNIDKEIDFLEAYAKAKNSKEITVATFSNTIHTTKSFSLNDNNFKGLKKFLYNQSFDGGTYFSSIDSNQYKSSQYLLFSDGLFTLGVGTIDLHNAPLFCINSSATANHSLLKKIAASSNGNYINLNSTSIADGLKEMDNRRIKVLPLTQQDVEINDNGPAQPGSWQTITGKVKNTWGSIDLQLNNGQTTTGPSLFISLPFTPNYSQGVIDTAMMLQEYQQLESSEGNDANIISFAKQHKLVSGGTSFIVLDNVLDYIEHGIVPPSDLQQEYEKNLPLVKQKEEQQKQALMNEEINNLTTAASLYNERIHWWDGKAALINLQQLDIKKEIPITQNSNNGEAKPDAVASNQNKTLTSVKDKADAVAAFSNKNPNSKNFNSVSSLNEVVVTGFQRINRKNFTGSAVTVKADDIRQGGATDPSRMLEGRVAGLSVQNVSSTFGSAPKIRIRGATSLRGDNKPLWVVDGIVQEDIINISNDQLASGDPATLLGSSMAGINSNDIETIDVLKDAAATALYGARAMNGVIVVTTKRGKVTEIDSDEEEDKIHLSEIKNNNRPAVYAEYLNAKDSFVRESSFYFEAAQLFFEKGDTATGIRILSNLAEIDNENHQLLRAMGYVLEHWKLYSQAIEAYQKILAIKEEEPQSYRDLALAYEKAGNHQMAVDLLYKVITKNFNQYENRYRGLKSLMLNEMNAIINLHPGTLCVTNINEAIIKPLPADIRIVVDWNKDETDIDLHIEEPNKETCFYGNRLTKKGGRLSEDFTQGYGPEEYEIKEAQKGKYIISVGYYSDNYQKQQTPSFIKLTIFKNFGRPNQTVYTESIKMDKLSGKIEIGEVKF